MKWILFSLLLLLPSEVYTAPANRDELKKKVVDLHHLIKEQSKELAVAHEANNALDSQLHLAQSRLADTQQQLEDLTGDVKKLQKWAAQTEIKRQDAMDAFHVVKRKLASASEQSSRLKWIISGTLSFLATVFASRLSSIFQAPWSFIVPLIMGAATFLALWTVL